ncbi:MAG: trypsin-like peptidase domain-containing protein [bacterium]
MKPFRLMILFLIIVFFQIDVFAEGQVIGEHLYERTLESPHPYPASPTGKPTLVWSEVYEFPGASYLVFEFSKFDLAPGDWLEVRHPWGEQVHVYEGLGFKNKGGDFITKAVLGSEAVIELYSTNTAHDHYGYRIDRVSRGFNEEELSRLYPGDRAICGADDKRDAKCYENSYPEVYEKSKAVARLLMDGSELCTAWLVSCDNHVLTNSHCSISGDFDSQAKLDRMEFQFIYQRPQCGSGTATVEYSFMGGTFLENEHYIDYTLIQAPAGEDPAGTYGWLNIDDRLADIDEQMFIVGHPGGRPKEISLESTHSQDQSGLCEVYSLNEPACISGATVQEIGYYCDTEGGSSGSPVLSLNTLKAIALHHCANCPNRGVRIQDVWNHNQAGPNPLPPCSLYNDIGQVKLDRGKYGCEEDTVTIVVNDGSLRGAGTQDVSIWSDSEIDPETVTLQETPSDSATFVGTLLTTTSSPASGDGYLSVAPGDTITVLYIDEDDGQGGVNIPRNAYAEIDCTPPVISNVSVNYVSALEAEISWDTNEPCIGAIQYGPTRPPTLETTSDSPLTNHHTILLENLEGCTYYFFKVLSSDEAGNLAEDDNTGDFYRFLTLQITILLRENMDTDPGWTNEGDWAWGQPTGQGGQYGSPDPTSGYTGLNVVGYNLNGDYPNSMSTTHWTTTQAFDCSDASEVYLDFYAWLGVETYYYDHAYIAISNNNGSSWSTIWENPGRIDGGSWEPWNFDISNKAAGYSQVKLRWGMGPTDSSWRFCGWNIDDVLVSFTSECTLPTPTPPIPTPTPTPDCIHHGDVDFNGIVSSGDAQLAFMIALGQIIPTYEEACAADCNGDGFISSVDAQLIMMMALGAGTCVDPL